MLSICNRNGTQQKPRFFCNVNEERDAVDEGNRSKPLLLLPRCALGRDQKRKVRLLLTAQDTQELFEMFTATTTNGTTIIGKKCPNSTRPTVCVECCADTDCPNYALGQTCDVGNGYCSMAGCTVFKCLNGAGKQVCKTDGKGCVVQIGRAHV